MLIYLDKHLDGPLGIHVLPYCDDEEQCEGLIIKEIVRDGRIDRDGRFAIGDRIIEVNDQTLLNVNFETAQSLISKALKDTQLKLNIVKNSRKKQINHTLPNCSNETVDRSMAFHSNERLIDGNDVNLMRETPKDKLNDEKFCVQDTLTKFNAQQPNIANQFHQNHHNNPLSSTSSTPADSATELFNEATPDDFTSDTFQRNGAFNASNTRKVGKKYHIRLTKDTNGLGFTITTRDNQVGQGPIYIKNILPVGVAKRDGNLKGGDRLLEVNGIQMTGKRQEEACQVLRDIEIGQTVDLIVSRQESNFDRTSNHSSFNRQTDSVNDNAAENLASNSAGNPMGNSMSNPADSAVSTPNSKLSSQLPRHLPSAERPDESQLDLTKTREVLSFNILLNDTGSAGLGLSVKGKRSTSSSTKRSTDLGIFVKKVLCGGAAYKDGRLRPNDQLISINGVSLLNSSNEVATDTLRRVLVNNEGMHAASNAINLVVARVTDPMENPNNSLLSNAMQSTNDELYETFGTRLTNDSFHQRNLSTISTDSVRLNIYDQNYRPSEQVRENTFVLSNGQFNGPRLNGNYNEQYGEPFNQRTQENLNGDFNELYNLNKKTHLYNGLMSKDSLSTDSAGFTISTPVKTSMKSDFTENELNISKFMNNSSRTDVLIENDDQENADPNVYRDYYKQTANGLDSSLNRSKNSQMMNLSNATNQLSLNDEEEAGGGFNFQRDGFGRQSMSEKRYAQLDAKNTDTFKKAKQRKMAENNDLKDSALPNADPYGPNTLVKSLSNYETTNLTSEQRQSKRSMSRFPANCCCFNESQIHSQSSPSSCPYHSSSSMRTSPKSGESNKNADAYSFESTSVKSNFPIDQQLLQARHLGGQQPTPFTLAAQHAGQLSPLKLNQPVANFGQPGYANRTNYDGYGAANGVANNFNHLNGHLNGNLTGNFNGNFANKNSQCHQMSPQFGQWLGMKKSSSLESLQTLMHEVKKENNVNYNTNLPYNTLRRPAKVTRNRNTNESFRTAIDKSYEEYMDNLAMETGMCQLVRAERVLSYPGMVEMGWQTAITENNRKTIV